MSRGYQLGNSFFGRVFKGLMGIGLAVLCAGAAQAMDNSYYYCRRSEGAKFTDLALTINGVNVTVQPYSSPESPGTRIYHGIIKQQYSSGNVYVDLNTNSQLQFLSPYPDMIMTVELVNKGESGYVRMLIGNDRSNDSILACQVKKIFY